LPTHEIVDLPDEAHKPNMSSPQMVADAIRAFAGRARLAVGGFEVSALDF